MFHVACLTWKDIDKIKSFAEGMGGPISCPCCSYHLETIDHLFVLCPHMHDFWHSFNTHNTLLLRLPLISVGAI
jgi:zinc-binding in reverse transcriptase